MVSMNRASQQHDAAMLPGLCVFPNRRTMRRWASAFQRLYRSASIFCSSVDGNPDMSLRSQGVAIPAARPSSAGTFAVGSGSARERLPAPAFGSSPNLQALALDAAAEPSLEPRTFQEITVVSADQPKLLSRLSEVMVRLP